MLDRAEKRCKTNPQLRFDRAYLNKIYFPSTARHITPSWSQPPGTPGTRLSHPFDPGNMLVSSCHGIRKQPHAEHLIQQPRENTTAATEYFVTHSGSTNGIADPQTRSTTSIIKQQTLPSTSNLSPGISSCMLQLLPKDTNHGSSASSANKQRQRCERASPALYFPRFLLLHI